MMMMSTENISPVSVFKQIRLNKIPSSAKSELGNQVARYTQSNSICCCLSVAHYIEAFLLLFNTYGSSKSGIGTRSRENPK